MAKIKLTEHDKTQTTQSVLGLLRKGQISSALATGEKTTHKDLFPDSWETPYRWTYELGTRFVVWLNIPDPKECARLTAWIEERHSWKPLQHRGFFKGQRQVMLRPDLTPMNSNVDERWLAIPPGRLG